MASITVPKFPDMDFRNDRELRHRRSEIGQTFQGKFKNVSDRSSKNHVYPRPDLIGIASYLNNPRSQKSRSNSPNFISTKLSPEQDIQENFIYLYDVTTTRRTLFSADQKGLSDFKRYKEDSKSSLIFLRGFPSRDWLNGLGELYEPAPELYRRHLEFQAFTSGARDYHLSSPLPSASARVFQLSMPTICSRNVDVTGYEPEDLSESTPGPWNPALGTKSWETYFYPIIIH